MRNIMRVQYVFMSEIYILGCCQHAAFADFILDIIKANDILTALLFKTGYAV